MKQPKRLTLYQKKAVSAYNLNPDDWMLVAETEFYLRIIHKRSTEMRSVDKFARPLRSRYA